MFGLTFLELLIVGIIAIVPVGTVVFLLLRTRQSAAAKPTSPTPPQFPMQAVDSSAVVARLTKRFCPQCRAPLAADAPQGLCPACLLAGGLADSEPRAATPPEAIDAALAEVQAHRPELEVLELLGRGGMGAVYKARQTHLDRTVALKLIRPEDAGDPAFAERFGREARAMARLNHPNIVTVHDFGKAGDTFYLIMEYVDGVNLRQALKAGGVTPPEALSIVPQICDALQFAHDQGVVHRDIKPENVLLDRSGRIKIADFGLAKLLKQGLDGYSLTQTQHVVGTPRYMAPEQLDRPTAVDHRADIYSLGVVIYEMLTGELPVGHFPPPSERVEVDVKIDRVVLRALAREPEKRYQQASEVKSDISSVGSGTLVAELAGRSWPSPPAKPAPSDTPALSPEAARKLVSGPAIGLIATGLLGLAPFVTLLILNWMPLYRVFAAAPFTDADFARLPAPVLLAEDARVGAPMMHRGTYFGDFIVVVMFVVFIVTVIPSLLILLGGWQMMRLQSYGLVMIGSIAALLPCSIHWPLGLPMGIWALVVLSRREVRAAFGS